MDGPELSRRVKEDGEFYTQEKFTNLNAVGLDFSGGIFSEVEFRNCDFSEATFSERSLGKSLGP